MGNHRSGLELINCEESKSDLSKFFSIFVMQLQSDSLPIEVSQPSAWIHGETGEHIHRWVCVCVCVCEWKRESEDSLWRCSQWELQVCWLICFLWKSYFWKPVEDSKEMQITSWKNLSAWERKKVEGGLFYFVDVDMNARCLFMPW